MGGALSRNICSPPAETHFGDMVINSPVSHQFTTSLSRLLSNFFSSTNQASLSCLLISSLACLMPSPFTVFLNVIISSHLPSRFFRQHFGKLTLNEITLMPLVLLLGSLSAFSHPTTFEYLGTRRRPSIAPPADFCTVVFSLILPSTHLWISQAFFLESFYSIT